MADYEQACQGNFKEAVCIDAYRVYDSCGDKDCLEDLRVYFNEAGQEVIDRAHSVRIRDVDVLTVYLDLEPVPFHKGFYTVDMTFFFEVNLDVFQAPAAPALSVCGLSIFSKKVVLYGSEGSVKVFSSDFAMDDLDLQNAPVRNLPKASVQVADSNMITAPRGLGPRIRPRAGRFLMLSPCACAPGRFSFLFSFLHLFIGNREIENGSREAADKG